MKVRAVMTRIHALEGRIHLQGIGLVPAIPATEVRPGMLLSWNYAPHGYKVLAVRKVSPQFLEITEANRDTGEVFRRKVKESRLVAAEWPKERDRRRPARRDPKKDGTRERLIRAIYARTLKDYRLKTAEGHKILVWGKGGTTLETLEKLPTAELEKLAARDASRRPRRRR